MRCDCGHDFRADSTEIEDVVGAQLGPAQGAVAGYGLGVLGSLGTVLFLHGKWLFFALAIFCGVRLYRAAIRLAGIRQSLRELPRPPRAYARKPGRRSPPSS
jgi:hypothetical protein